MSAAGDSRTPVTLLTGFLGSGKTTVLNHLLGCAELADTAVIINEFGAVGIDHLLVDHVAENMRLLASGCLCCTVRGDLIDTLGTLVQRRARGEIAFSRVVIETTGLADPAPVLHTLMADPAVVPHFRLDGVVTTVDAVNGPGTLRGHAEAVKQVGVADALLLTKTDLVDAAGVEALLERLALINPGARVCHAIDGVVDPARVLGVGWVDPAGAGGREWLDRGEAVSALQSPRRGHEHRHDHDPDRHDAQVRAHAFVFDTPLHQGAFSHWLELMAAMRGERLLRVKGLVQLAESPDEPLVVHGVQHVFHPPQRLPAWPSADRRSRLVFIVRDIAREEIERTFRKFVLPPEESTV